METAWSMLAAFGLPTAATGFFVWLLKRSIDKRDKKRDEEQNKKEAKLEERERNREKLDLYLVKITKASVELGEATAKAVQRIPDAHCNGDMSKALEYVAKVRRDQKDFLISLGVHSLHED